MEDEPWEALDVDDSDLPSLLRPCKQKRLCLSQITTSTSTSASAVSTPQTQQHSSQTITQKLSRNQNSNPNPRRLIPGPAGPVQSAMFRKTRDRELHNSDDSNPISTQEYIRKAVENSSPEFDHDFQANPWLSALKFLGVVDGVVPSTPLSSIKKCANVGKVDKIVAVIKSCTPNGLGGLMVTLKDPTGTVGASIHHKVLSESEYAKDLSLGSVLILQQVAVFAPSQSVYYLNIALKNLVKVFSKCDGPPPKHSFLANTIRYSSPNIDCGVKASRLEISKEDIQRNTEKRQVVEANKENLLPQSSIYRNEDCFVKEYNLAKEGDLIINNSNEETAKVSEVEKLTQPLISKDSLPQWTDEQLQQLFASDGEDDDTMF